MRLYEHKLISSRQIRLVKLLPSIDRSAELRCEILEYNLTDHAAGHPYEALSYAWGSEERPRKLYTHDAELHITNNLHSALQHLRYDQYPRLLWVDAVCIDQEHNLAEKETQIQLMVTIYALADRVLVWLGEAYDGSSEALEVIRAAVQRSAYNRDDDKTDADTHMARYIMHRPLWEPHDGALTYDQMLVQSLVKRSWFSRIWVLQEVAAARQITIICGNARLDGQAFSSGLDILISQLPHLDCPVISLMRNAHLRQGSTLKADGTMPTLSICPMIELIERYQSQRATHRVDRVYALLGLSTDNHGLQEIKPDYTLSWQELLTQVAKFVFGPEVTIASWHKDSPILQHNMIVLGVVEDLVTRKDQQTVWLRRAEGLMRHPLEQYSYHVTGKEVQRGDFVCFLTGLSTPSILRAQDGVLTTIAISPAYDKQTQAYLNLIRDDIRADARSTRLLCFHWDWTQSDCETLSPVARARLAWDAAAAFHAVGMQRDAADHLARAKSSFEAEVRTHGPHVADIHLLPATWATIHGNTEVLRRILEVDDRVATDLDESGRSLLTIASSRGCMNVAKLLLGHVDVNARGANGSTTALQAASAGGYIGIAKLLLEHQADINARGDEYGTALEAAIAAGHIDTVKLLLDMEVESDEGTVTLAATNGFAEIVDRLLSDGTQQELSGAFTKTTRTGHRWLGCCEKALIGASRNGHAMVVQVLLRNQAVYASLLKHTGKVLDAVEAASSNGHTEVVKVLWLSELLGVTRVGWAASTEYRERVSRDDEYELMPVICGKPRISGVPHELWRIEEIARQAGHSEITELLRGHDVRRSSMSLHQGSLQDNLDCGSEKSLQRLDVHNVLEEESLDLQSLLVEGDLHHHGW